MRRFFITVLVNGLIINAVAAAQNNFNTDNFYVGSGIGPGIDYFVATNTSIMPPNPEHATFAWRLFTGKNFNKNFALEFGYTDFGYYENSAAGYAICDMHGACGYPKVNIANGIFNTQLNVVNEISGYAIDLSAIMRYNLTNCFNLFARGGVSYVNATLISNTTVNPMIPVSIGTNISPTINQTSTANNGNNILPLVGLGYEYKANSILNIRFEYDSYFGSPMFNQAGVNQGSLYPSVILLSTVFNL